MTYKHRTDLSADCIRSVLTFDREIGIFRWRESRSHVRGGDLAGCRQTSGYISIQIDGHRYMAHRLAWIYVSGQWSVKEIDHIDGNKANNAFSNLREATRAENNRNTSSKGYTFVKKLKKFRAQIVFNRQHYELGLFEREEDARAAYVAGSRRLFGEFSGTHRGFR